MKIILHDILTCEDSCFRPKVHVVFLWCLYNNAEHLAKTPIGYETFITDILSYRAGRLLIFDTETMKYVTFPSPNGALFLSSAGKKD